MGPRHRADAEQQFDFVERGTVGMGRIVQNVEHDDALRRNRARVSLGPR